jgi:uncharacterized membrane protein
MTRGLRGLALAECGFAGTAALVARSRSRGKALRAVRVSYIRPMGLSDGCSATRFEAVIVPHRSLSRRGLGILMAVIGLLGALTVLRFAVIGAWPVAGFSIVEIGFAVLLLRLNARRASATELVLLSDDALRIVHTDRRGRRQERVLPIGWLDAVLEERPGRVPRLLLIAHGVHEEIAAQLGEAEKRDLWAALRAALHRLRNPAFDNPQLRVPSGES